MKLTKKIDELTLERDTLKLDVEGLHLMMVKHHWQKTKEWIKTCKEMTDCIQNYVANLTTQVHEAIQEFNANPERKLPWKIYKLLKYFQDLTKSFSTEWNVITCLLVIHFRINDVLYNLNETKGYALLNFLAYVSDIIYRGKYSPWINVNQILILRCIDPCANCGGRITLLVHKTSSIEK